jgi:hypothetical protein
MAGVDVPILVPVAYRALGGWKRSEFGVRVDFRDGHDRR